MLASRFENVGSSHVKYSGASTYEHTTILSYNPLRLQNFASTCSRSFELQPEKGSWKRRGIQIANRWWRRGCFFVALFPQQLESV